MKYPLPFLFLVVPVTTPYANLVEQSQNATFPPFTKQQESSTIQRKNTVSFLHHSNSLHPRETQRTDTCPLMHITVYRPPIRDSCISMVQTPSTQTYSPPPTPMLRLLSVTASSCFAMSKLRAQSGRPLVRPCPKPLEDALSDRRRANAGRGGYDMLFARDLR